MGKTSLCLLLLLCSCLCSCVGSVWTGATLLYDRHHVYKKVSDYQLNLSLNNALYTDNQLKADGCILDVTVFNGYVLLSGHLPSKRLYDLACKRLGTLQGYSHVYNAIAVNKNPSRNLEDAWITTKIRSQMFANADIDPKAFKIVTTDGIVYLLGEVRKEQASLVIEIARQTQGVIRVVNCLRYFTYQEIELIRSDHKGINYES